MIDKEEATRRQKELERTVKEKKGEEESIQRQLDKQGMNHCHAMKEPVDVQSKYPALFVTIGPFFLHNYLSSGCRQLNLCRLHHHLQNARRCLIAEFHPVYLFLD